MLSTVVTSVTEVVVIRHAGVETVLTLWHDGNASLLSKIQSDVSKIVGLLLRVLHRLWRRHG